MSNRVIGDPEAAAADHPESMSQFKPDFLTPTERARKNHLSQNLKANGEESRRWNCMYKLLAQEKMRQNYLDMFSRKSLLVFHAESAAANFQAYSPKTFRGFMIKLMISGAKFNENTDFENTYLDQFILCGILFSCLFHAVLSDKICESRLHDLDSGSGYLWDGETGILKTFYRDSKCRSSDNATRSKMMFLLAIDVVFTVMVSLEMIIKVISKGLIMNKRSYLREGWGIFEFLNVILSWIQFIPGSHNMSFIQLARILRPLQTMHPEMHLVISCIINSLRPVANIMLIASFIMLAFSLLGMAIFAGSFRGRCFNAGTLAQRGDLAASAPGGMCSLHFPVGACPSGQVCLQAPPGGLCTVAPSDTYCHNQNPDRFHFDGVWPALLSILRALLGDKWSETLSYADEATGPASALLYFVPVVSALQWLVAPLFTAACWHEVVRCKAARAYRPSSPAEVPADLDQRLAPQQPPINAVGGTARPTAVVETLVLLAGRVLSPVARVVRHGARSGCPAWLATRLAGSAEGRERQLRKLQRAAAAAVGHWAMDGGVLLFVTVNVLTMCLYHFNSTEYEDSLCAALGQRIHGTGSNLSCTGPLSPPRWNRTSRAPESMFVPRNGFGGLETVVGNGFCRKLTNASELCFSSWSVLDQHSFSYVDVCPDGTCLGMPDSLAKGLHGLNIFFTLVFFLEIIIKMFALGAAEYLMTFENSLDFVVVCTSLALICSPYSKTSGIIALRFFRVLRVGHLLRRWRGMRLFTAAMIRAAPQIWSLVIVLILFIFAFAQAGSEFLGGKLHCANHNRTNFLVSSSLSTEPGLLCNFPSTSIFQVIKRTNFDSYLPGPDGYGGFVTVVVLVTRERWSELMKLSYASGLGFGVDIFLIAIIVFGRFILLNMFMVIVVTNFVEASNQEKSTVQTTTDDDDISSSLISKLSGIFSTFLGLWAVVTAGMHFVFRNIMGSRWFHFVMAKIREANRVANECGFALRATMHRSNAIHDEASMTTILPTGPTKPSRAERFRFALSSSRSHCFRKIVEWRFRTANTFSRLPWVAGFLHHQNQWRVYLLRIILSDVFEVCILVSVFISAIFVLIEDPLALRTECCPEVFNYQVNASYFKNDRFCYRGQDVSSTCSGHGSCKSNGRCLCDTHPEYYTRELCQCKWFSSFLCAENWLPVDHSNWFKAFRAIDYIFAAIFVMEAASRIFCCGLLWPYQEDGAIVPAYLQDPLHIWDGAVTVLTICALAWNHPARESVRTLRLLRFIRPLYRLRIFSEKFFPAKYFRKIALPSASILIVIASVTGVFAIIGLQLFSGRMHSCRNPANYPLVYPTLPEKNNVSNILQCLQKGGVWASPAFAFDNIFDSLLVMLLISTDGWVDYMDMAVDSTSVGVSPVVMNSPWTSVCFVLYVLIAQTILLHTFLAVIVSEFIMVVPTKFSSEGVQGSLGICAETNETGKCSEGIFSVDDFELERFRSDRLLEPTVCVDDVVDDARTGIEFDRNVPETGSYRLSDDMINAAKPLVGVNSNPSSGPSRKTIKSSKSHALQISSAPGHVCNNTGSMNTFGQPNNSLALDTTECNSPRIDTERTSDARPIGFIRKEGQYSFKLVMNQGIEWGVVCLVSINVIVMSFNTFPEENFELINVADTLFSTIYFAEFILKFSALGPSRFWLSAWNQFDATIAILCFVFAIIRNFRHTRGQLNGFPAISILRCFRLIGLCHLGFCPETIQRGYRAITFSLPLIFKIALLIALAWMSFISLGISAFYNVRWTNTESGYIDKHSHFQSVSNSFIALLPICFGDGWIKFMAGTAYDEKEYSCFFDLDLDGSFIDEGGCGGKSVSVLYFASIYFVHMFIFRNIILCEVISKYCEVPDERQILNQKFHWALKQLIYAYAGLDPHHTGMIKQRKLRDLLLLSSFPTSHCRSMPVKSAVAFAHLISPFLDVKHVAHDPLNSQSPLKRHITFPSSIYACFKTAYQQLESPVPSVVLETLYLAYEDTQQSSPDLLDQGCKLEEPKLHYHAACVLQYAFCSFMANSKAMSSIKENFMNSRARNLRRDSFIRKIQRNIFLRAGSAWSAFLASNKRPTKPVAQGSVLVTLVTAKHLQASTHLRKCDPFAVITCGWVSKNSATLANTNDPIWDQKFHFDFDDLSADINIEIFDDEALRKKSLGRVCIPLSTAFLAPEMKLKRWFQLPAVNSTSQKEVPFVFLEVEVNMYKWLIHLQVVSCRTLPEHNLDDQTEINPYVCVLVENKMFLGLPAMNSHSPAFSETLTFPLTALEGEIRIVILNHQPGNAVGDTFVGQLKITPSSITEAQNVCSDVFSGEKMHGSWLLKKWYPLHEQDNRPPWAQVHVILIEAKGLPKMDVFGKVDCFCVTRLIKEDSHLTKGQKSSVQFSTFCPVWNQHFVFDLFDHKSYLALDLFDYNVDGCHRLIGSTRIELSQFEAESEAVDRWYDVNHVEGQGPLVDGSLGSLRVSIVMNTKNIDIIGAFGYIAVNTSAELIPSIPLLADIELQQPYIPDQREADYGQAMNTPSDLLNVCLNIALIEGNVISPPNNCHLYCTLDLPRYNWQTKMIPSNSNPRWCEEFLVQRIEINSFIEIQLCAKTNHANQDKMQIPNMNDGIIVKQDSHNALGCIKISVSELWKAYLGWRSSQSVDVEDRFMEWKLDEFFQMERTTGANANTNSTLRLIFNFVPQNHEPESLELDALEARKTIRRILQRKHLENKLLKPTNQKDLDDPPVLKVSPSQTTGHLSQLYYSLKILKVFCFNLLRITRRTSLGKSFTPNPAVALQSAGISKDQHAILFDTQEFQEPPLQPLDPMRYLEATGRTDPLSRWASARISESPSSRNAVTDANALTKQGGMVRDNYQAQSPFFEPIEGLERSENHADVLHQENKIRVDLQVVGKCDDLEGLPNHVIRRDSALHEDDL